MHQQNDTQIEVRPYKTEDLEELEAIWNGIVATGESFPETEFLNKESAAIFFAKQSHVGVAFYKNCIAGLYVLHPNNVGRCGHIANASYAVKPEFRGKGIGRTLVENSLGVAKEYGFRIMQFNAVLAKNTAALKLYESLGFTRLGTIEGGFRLDGEIYVDIHPMYRSLV